MLLLVGAAVVFMVLAVGLIRDMAGDTAGPDGGEGATEDRDPAARPAGVPADAHAAIVDHVDRALRAVWIEDARS